MSSQPTGIKPVPSFVCDDPRHCFPFQRQEAGSLPSASSHPGCKHTDIFSPFSQENAQDCGGTAEISVSPTLLLLPLVLLLR